MAASARSAARTLRCLLVCGGLVCAASPLAEAGEACPSFDDVPARIAAAPGCAEAFAVMDSCQLGSSGDVASGEAVEAKCEPLFVAKLTAPRKRTYEVAKARCSTKYAGKQVTMYLSFAAFCSAKLAVDYARRYGHP